MRNPWETGEVFRIGGRVIRSAWCDATSRIDAARNMDAAKLRQCLAWPDTQKTVRRFIERRLRKLDAARVSERGQPNNDHTTAGSDVHTSRRTK